MHPCLPCSNARISSGRESAVKKFLMVYVTAATAVLLLGLQGCERDGPAERAGEQVDDAGAAVREGARETGETLREGAQATGEAVRDGAAEVREEAAEVRDRVRE
jgi:hypothetical protein